jgi:hypothetical protein
MGGYPGIKDKPDNLLLKEKEINSSQIRAI